MELNKNLRTTRDALINELIGDIGRLDDKIKALPDAIAGAIKPTVSSIATILVEARTSIEKLATAQKNSLQQFVAQEKSTLREDLKFALRTEVNAVFEKVSRDQKDFIQTKTQGMVGITAIMVAFIAGLCSGATCVIGISQSIQQEDYDYFFKSKRTYEAHRT